MLPQSDSRAWLRDRHTHFSPWDLNIAHFMVYQRIYPSFDLSAAYASRRTYLPSRSPALSFHQLTSSLSQQSVAQYGHPGYTSTSRRSDTGHGTQHGYILLALTTAWASPYYWPIFCVSPTVGLPPSASTATPSARHKHGGKDTLSGGQGERGEIA